MWLQVKLVVILLAGIATAVYSFVFASQTNWTVRITLNGLPTPSHTFSHLLPCVPQVRITLIGLLTPSHTFPHLLPCVPQVRITLIGLLSLRAFQTWRSVVNTKSTMNEFIQNTLYHPPPHTVH